MCEQARPSASDPFSFAMQTLRAAPAACADEVVCRHSPSHVNKLGCEDSSPAGDTAQPRGRPMAQPSRPQSGQEKERENRWIKLACIHGILSLFRIACRNTYAHKIVPFGWVLGRGFGLESRLPNVSPITSKRSDCSKPRGRRYQSLPRAGRGSNRARDRGRPFR